jgi:REP element-mobilizing transposase RayT
MNNVSLYAFVVMPNHIHVMIQCPATCPFKDWVRAFKTGTAQLLVRSAQVRGKETLLKEMKAAVTRPNKQRYKIWEDGYLAKSVFSPKFLRQKMTYIHNNPVQAHWRLAETPEAYPWSSARYYVLGEPCMIPIRDVWAEG